MGRPQKGASETGTREKTKDRNKEKENTSLRNLQSTPRDIAPMFRRNSTGRDEVSKKSLSRGVRREATERDTEDSDSEGEEGGENALLYAQLAKLPSKSEIKEMLQEVTTSIREDISGLKKEFAEMVTRTEEVERQTSNLQQNQKVIYEKLQHQENLISDLMRQMEDQENRSRRKNIRIRGVPETILNEDIKTFLQQIFNNILNKEKVKEKMMEIQIERAHRLMKPKTIAPAAPRDILCRLHSFAVKEEILQKSKEVENIIYEDNTLTFFQDLSRTTLRKRKTLKPLTDMLREKKILYRWGFPFSLSVQKDGISAILRSEKDLGNFLKKLHLPAIEIPDWPDEHRIKADLRMDQGKEWSESSVPKNINAKKGKAKEIKDFTLQGGL